MPLQFATVCELLEEAHKLCLATKPTRTAVEAWFARHRTTIDAHDTNLTALLSTLLPEKRTDRVYYIQTNALEKVIGRGLCLRSSRIPDLARYRQPGSNVDLAECVGNVLTVTPNAISCEMVVDVEEVDRLLHGLASRIKFSSPAIRASRTGTTAPDRVDLSNLYRRLTSLEAKWLTRLVLKSFAPLVLDENLVYRLCDPILPSVLQVQSDFTCALEVLQSARNRLLPSEKGSGTTRRKLLAQVKPRLGVKVGRQHWSQARSIKHCLSLGSGRMSVEDKVDGEYCQIHINLASAKQCVQIFSKSGKDSTEDKEALHGIILDSLGVGKSTCRLSKGCILEGEVVVYSDHEKKILPFHKIRNHITRRGLYLNTEQDSLPKAGEHLMIVYYDILFLEDDSLLGVRHSERRRILSTLIKCQLGWAELVKSEIIDFGSPLAASNLRNVFAKTIVNRQEGLVLRVDEPYFDFSIPERPWTGRCIKLKKEYIGGFGDIGDFAIIGAGYDVSKARQYNIEGLKWTHFYLACLCNKEQVERWAGIPEFSVVSVVELNQTQLRSILQSGNPVAAPKDENDKFKISIQPGLKTNLPMTSVFTQPLVVDLRCFSFDKVGNTGFWSPRFPVVSRVHLDRGFMEALTFQELQQKAQDATKVPPQPDSQENLQWIAKLEGADPRGIAVDAVSQQTATTVPTPSPRRSTQSSSQNWSSSPTKVISLARSATLPVTSSAAHVGSAINFPPPPKSSLITPPTSSDPLPPSPKYQDSTRARKRASPESSQTPQQISQTPKRRKSAEKQQRLAASLMSKHESQRATKRAVLTETDGNSSQRSTSSSQAAKSRLPKKCTMAQQPEIIDLTQSPETSFTEAPLNAESPSKSQESGTTTLELRKDSLNNAREAIRDIAPGHGEAPRPTDSQASLQMAADEEASQPMTTNSQASDYVNLFMPGWDHAKDNDEYPSQLSQKTGDTSRSSDVDRDDCPTSVGPPAELGASPVPISPSQISPCKYAGGHCYFLDKKLYLAPCVWDDRSVEVDALLKDHGFDGPATPLSWDGVMRIVAGYTSLNGDARKDVVFLVDSVEHAAETEVFCAQIKSLRDQARDTETSVSVTFYDWRVMKHLTVYEDEGITEKYYDGFNSPLRRWFAGSL